MLVIQFKMLLAFQCLKKNFFIICKAVINRHLRKKENEGKWLYFNQENEVGILLSVSW